MTDQPTFTTHVELPTRERAELVDNLNTLVATTIEQRSPLTC